MSKLARSSNIGDHLSIIAIILMAITLGQACKVRRNNNSSKELFYSVSADPGGMVFESEVFIPQDADSESFSAEEYVEGGSQHAIAIAAAKDQATYMQSALMNHRAHAAMPITPGGDPTIQIVDAERRSRLGVSVYYRLKTNVAVDRQRFANGAKQLPVIFYLPYSPEAFYDKNVIKDAQGNFLGQSCTVDPHYPKYVNFFHFWDIDPAVVPRCKVDLNSDVVKVHAKLTKSESTVKTFPEYAKLFSNRDGNHPIQMRVIFGVDAEKIESDIGVIEFRKFVNYYDSRAGRGEGIGSGSLKIVQKDSYRTIYDIQNIKSWTTQPFNIRMEVTVLDQREDAEFLPAAAKALEEADVFIYSGHSGLGKNFRISRIEDFIKRPLALPKDKYQIAFFNGCSSWTYYSQAYFDHKATSQDPLGTANFDTVTNGLSGYFKDMLPVLTSFTNRLLFAKSPLSWQEIVAWQPNMSRSASSSNITDAFTIVDGDEDNPTTAPTDL